MAESLVALIYGEALYGAAKETEQCSRILEEIGSLAEVYKQDEDFRAFLNSPAISPAEKKACLAGIFGSLYCEETINFLFVLVDKGRTSHLPHIAKEFRRRYDQAEGIAEGKIYSPVALQEGKIAQFEKEMGKLLGKQVQLKNKIDTSLIGGVKIKVDGKIIDKSLKNDLIKLRKKLEE